MKTLNEYFDIAKEKSGSDYATAKALGISANRIYMARKANGMNNKMAREVAEYIGVNPIAIIAAAEAAKHPEEAKAWGKWVASVCLMVNIASPALQGIASNDYVRTLYIMLN